MTKINIALPIIASCFFQLSCTAMASDKPGVTEYEVIEIKEGEFQPTNEDGTKDGEKYSAYFLSLESTEGETQESHKRGDHYYVGVKAGGVMPTNLGGNTPLSGQAPNTTYIVGLSAGRKFMDRFAVEFEYSYIGESKISANVDNQLSGSNSYTWKAKSNIFMINFSGDLVKGRYFRPYVKAGLGLVRNNASSFINDDTPRAVVTYLGRTTNEFVWKLGCGLNATINDKIDASLEYNYINLGKIKTQSTFMSTIGSGNSKPGNSTAQIGKLKANIITIGLKFKF